MRAHAPPLRRAPPPAAAPRVAPAPSARAPQPAERRAAGSWALRAASSRARPSRGRGAAYFGTAAAPPRALLERVASGAARLAISHDFVDRVDASPGAPLPDRLRGAAERTLVGDLGRARLHAGPGAAALARALSAEAFTVGSDVYFAAGAFTTATRGGLRLLGHELAHAAARPGAPPTLELGQPGDPAERDAERAGEAVAAGLAEGEPRRAPSVVRPTPRSAGAGGHIRRRLLVTGAAIDVRALLDLLEAASGFTLAYDAHTHVVSIAAERLAPPSVVMASQLETIIEDPAQDAELHVGRGQQGVSVGAFPMSGPMVQEIDVEHLQRIEAGAPGNGAALIAHELVENYRAHAQTFGQWKAQDLSRSSIFELTHAEALDVEAGVAGELVAPGRRVAHATAVVPHRGKDLWVRNVDDYETYFLVTDTRGGRMEVRRAARIRVSSRGLDGFGKGSHAVPAAAQPTIDAIAVDLRMHPTATVRVEARDQDPVVAERLGEAVRDAILDSGKSGHLYGFDLRSELNFDVVATAHAPGAGDQVVVTVEEPDTEVAAQRGRIVQQVLGGARTRRAPAGPSDWRPRR